jgi:uncharacterized protein YecE (DUF72 family)
MAVRIGTAGWAIPRAVAAAFPGEGSGLQRYAARFDAVEVNSRFYRPHKPETWARWAESTPPEFRFAVKAPKTVTHDARLVDTEAPMAAFFEELAALGSKLGPILLQFPPSLPYDPDIAARFFGDLRERFDGLVAAEPRHASWFEPDAETVLVKHRIARVAADPTKVVAAAEPGGWRGLTYVRLHGSPRMYWSAYDAAYLDTLAARLKRAPGEVWCIFDNTASGAAAADALGLQERLS